MHGCRRRDRATLRSAARAHRRRRGPLTRELRPRDRPPLSTSQIDPVVLRAFAWRRHRATRRRGRACRRRDEPLHRAACARVQRRPCATSSASTSAPDSGCVNQISVSSQTGTDPSVATTRLTSSGSVVASVAAWMTASRRRCSSSACLREVVSTSTFCQYAGTPLASGTAVVVTSAQNSAPSDLRNRRSTFDCASSPLRRRSRSASACAACSGCAAARSDPALLSASMPNIDEKASFAWITSAFRSVRATASCGSLKSAAKRRCPSRIAICESAWSKAAAAPAARTSRVAATRSSMRSTLRVQATEITPIGAPLRRMG